MLGDHSGFRSKKNINNILFPLSFNQAKFYIRFVSLNTLKWIPVCLKGVVFNSLPQNFLLLEASFFRISLFPRNVIIIVSLLLNNPRKWPVPPIRCGLPSASPSGALKGQYHAIFSNTLKIEKTK